MQQNRTNRLKSAAAAALVALLPVAIAPAAAADPAPAAAEQAQESRIIFEDQRSDRVKALDLGWRSLIAGRDNVEEVWATAPAMDRGIPIVWIHPEGRDRMEPRPTLYVLNGADGGEGRASWLYQTDILDFFSDKNVNVAIIQAGEFSYYTDWVSSDTKYGTQMWETFLTRELPNAFESAVNANGKRGIIGMSMSATSVLNFAQHNPGLYDGVGSFSGCANVADEAGALAVRTVLDRAGIDPVQMWGQRPGELWNYNDSLINADKLVGQQMYISNGTGLWGEWDYVENPTVETETALAAQRTTGSAIEGATNLCTMALKNKLDGLGATGIHWDLGNNGTHSWGYWQDDLHESWDVLFSRVLY